MKINLRGNALAATGEQIVVGVTYFVFYGMLIRIAGPDLVGVLSLVLVLASVVSMTSAGFASALAHYVPVFEGQKDRASTVQCVDTTILCSAALYAAVLGVAYVPFSAMIVGQAGPEHGELVRRMMVPAVLHVFLSGVSAATTLALTALLRSDLRFWANLLGAVVGLTVLILVAPAAGVLAGLWGMMAQSATIAIVSWIQIVRVLPELGPLPRHFSRRMAKRLFGLGVNMQIQTLLVAAVEPATRLLIGAYGSLTAVAFFSMASRYVLQTRALIYAGAQPLVSAFSHERIGDPSAHSAMYVRAERVVGAIAILALSANVGAAPFIGELWIGERRVDFVVFSAILACGWLINALALTAYFYAYSLGMMRTSLVGHLLLLGLTLGFGAPLAIAFGALGAVSGMGLALMISGVFLRIGNSRHVAGHTALTGLRVHGFLGASAGIAAVAAIAAFSVLREFSSVWISGVGSGLAWLLLIAPAATIHPTGRDVRAYFATRARRSAERPSESASQ